MEVTSDVFQLSHTDARFNTRCCDIFSNLQYITFDSSKNDSSDSDFLKPDPDEEPLSMTSVYKIPQSAPRKTILPAYKRNPDKWTLIDLSDVSQDKMSDQSNRRVAFDFLQERASNSMASLKMQEEEEELMDTGNNADEHMHGLESHSQHTFRKPAKKIKHKDSGKHSDHIQTQETDLKFALEWQQEETETVEPKSIPAENEVAEVENICNNTEKDEGTFRCKLSKNKNRSFRTKVQAVDSDDEESQLTTLEADKSENRMNDNDKCESDDEFKDYIVSDSGDEEDDSNSVCAKKCSSTSTELPLQNDADMMYTDDLDDVD